MSRPRVLPGVETLDQRLVLSASHPTAHVAHPATEVASATRTFTPADLQAYANAYLSVRGGRFFNPAYDFDGNGKIQKSDAAPILRGLASITPPGPLKLTLALADGEQVPTPHPSSNGGVTARANVTIVGHTTPNSIIFSDGPTARLRYDLFDYHFRGTPIISDANGVFHYSVSLNKLSSGGSLTNTEFLIRTPFAQQVIRAFPITRIRP